MAKYDVREQGYTWVEAPRDEIEPVSWQQLPATGKIWVYIPVKADNEPGVGLPVASAEFPLLESYIDVVVEGALDYGETFARELLETTSDWSNFWLNDRELARRPWVYNPASSQVDALLMETSERPRNSSGACFPRPMRSTGLRKRRTRFTRLGLAGRTSAAIGRQSLCNQKLWFMTSLCEARRT